MEPKVAVPKVLSDPVTIILGPFVFKRDQWGDWSRNSLSLSWGSREVGLTDDAVLLAEEVTRLIREKEKGDAFERPAG